MDQAKITLDENDMKMFDSFIQNQPPQTMKGKHNDSLIQQENLKRKSIKYKTPIKPVLRLNNRSSFSSNMTPRHTIINAVEYDSNQS